MEESHEKKKTRKTRQSSKDKDKDSESKRAALEMDSVNIGEHITYDVLRMILEYSNIRDLTTAALVCRSWNEAASKEIQTRLRPQHILHNYATQKKEQKPQELFADELHIKPSIVLLFFGNEHAINEPPSDCICHHIHCLKDCITVHNYSLVHDNMELEGDIVTGLFLPEIPGVKMRCFSISADDVEQFRRTTRQRNLDKLAKEFCKISPTEDNIKAVILFASSEHVDGVEYSNDAKQILKTFVSRRTDGKGSPVSMWGGVTSNLIHCSFKPTGTSCKHNTALAGISICGPGISTWSIVLDSRIKTKAQVEKELTLFRDSVKLQKYSVGLMFACCGRGEEWYSEKNVEPKIFKKLFPNVPLVGSYGGGEFGVTTVPQESSKINGGIIYEYSTIFLILSYGSLRNIVK